MELSDGKFIEVGLSDKPDGVIWASVAMANYLLWKLVFQVSYGSVFWFTPALLLLLWVNSTSFPTIGTTVKVPTSSAVDYF